MYAVINGTWSYTNTLDSAELRLHPGDLLCEARPDGATLLPAALENGLSSENSLLRICGTSGEPAGNTEDNRFPSFLHLRGVFSPASISKDDKDLMRSVANMMISVVMATQSNATTSGSVSGVEPEVAMAILAMERAPAHPWTIQRLAGEAGISRSTLAQKFKDQTGQTPNDYLLNLRMRMAEEMLRGRTQHLKEIARRAGYQSVSAFSTAFKRWSGSSPSVHRRRPMQ